MSRFRLGCCALATLAMVVTSSPTYARTSNAPGQFLSLEALGADNWWLRIRVPPDLDPFLVFKGSIAIDGISLTIAALEADVLSVTIIPTPTGIPPAGHRAGALVNLECDVLAKHVEKLLRKLDLKAPLTVEKLRENGF